MSPRRPNPKPKPRPNKDGSVSWIVRFRPDPKRGPTDRSFATNAEAKNFGADIRDFGPTEALRRMAEREGRTAGPAQRDVDNWLERHAHGGDLPPAPGKRSRPSRYPAQSP